MWLWDVLTIAVGIIILERYAHYRLFKPHKLQGQLKRPFVTILGKQGLIYADYLKHTTDSKGLILCSHGNQSDIARCQPWSEQLYNLGYDILLYDYPGYGLSEGAPTEQNLFDCILTVYDYAHKKLGYSPQDIIAMGRSLGGGPSSYLATQRTLKALILDSTFISAYRVSLPFSLPGDKFKNKKLLSQVKALPILILHGKADQLIHYHHAEILYRVTRRHNHTKLVFIPGADHQNTFYFPEYWEAMASFLNQLNP